MIEGITAFVKAATNFVEIIEKNIQSYYNLKSRMEAQRQIEAIEDVLSIFPNIWFFNGTFINYLYVKSDEFDAIYSDRDISVINDFSERLDEIENNFGEKAPEIQGLGADMITLFKQQVSLRRKLLFRASEDEDFNLDGIRKIHESLKPLEVVEKRFHDLVWKLKHDSIREEGAKVPKVSNRVIAEEFRVSENLVEKLLRDNETN